MIKVKELTITTDLVEIGIVNEPFVTSLKATKEEVIKKYGEYTVINSYVYDNKTYLKIQED